MKPFESGRIGGTEGAGKTIRHYVDVMAPAYAFYFYDTFRVSLMASVAGLVLGYPVAYYVARQQNKRLRKAWIAFLIGMLFLSIVVRVYAILMAFGPVGPLKGLAWIMGMHAESPAFAGVQVGLGLLHSVLPLVALTLIGTIQNVNPKLEDAAQALGAPRWRSFTGITLVLSMPGIMSAFLISYAFSISSFVVPLILGKGIVQFVANLVFIRFSELNNYPSGAAIAMILLAISMLIVYGLTALVRRLWPTAA